MNNYDRFIKDKKVKFVNSGHDCKTDLSKLFDFQQDIVKWALYMGKACVFADTGLGKTAMQLHWASDVVRHENKPVLILAPLAVSRQTEQEAEKFGLECKYVRSQNDIIKGINITNYEMLNHFDLSSFGGIVMDESSLLKSYTGFYRNEIISRSLSIPYRLACTATPSPNDLQELGNHCEFMGIMSFSEMRSMFFLNDSGDTGSSWRLKGHAESEFWDFVSSWALMLSDPADIGYTEQTYKLPELRYNHIMTDESDLFMFDNTKMTLQDRNRVRRESIDSRCNASAAIVNSSSDIHVVWCNLNDESKLLAELIDDAVEVAGHHDNEYKADMMLDFAKGNIKCIVSKPKIAGMGLNWQVCHNQVFTGLSDSYEQFYQAVRRCWRFGQINPVTVNIVTSQKEGDVVENIIRKEKQHEKMKREMSERVKDITLARLKGTNPIRTDYKPDLGMIMPKWFNHAETCEGV